MNNAIYRKTMENLINRINEKLVNNKKTTKNIFKIYNKIKLYVTQNI